MSDNTITNTLQFTSAPFDKLNVEALYQALRLRAETFIVEQNGVYQDLDNLDQHSLHLMGWLDHVMVCYARITPPGTRFPEPSIGRVVCAAGHRGSGHGRSLTEQAIVLCNEHYPGRAIRISAQQYLERFYQSLGFASVSKPYLEDGIPHLEMLRPALNVAGDTPP
ncbi:MAG: GNAT family N-acetyltransferase [Pseudohongiellaceae bacterium]